VWAKSGAGELARYQEGRVDLSCGALGDASAGPADAWDVEYYI